MIKKTSQKDWVWNNTLSFLNLNVKLGTNYKFVRIFSKFMWAKLKMILSFRGFSKIVYKHCTFCEIFSTTTCFISFRNISFPQLLMFFLKKLFVLKDFSFWIIHNTCYLQPFTYNFTRLNISHYSLKQDKRRIISIGISSLPAVCYYKFPHFDFGIFVTFHSRDFLFKSLKLKFANFTKFFSCNFSL